MGTIIGFVFGVIIFLGVHFILTEWWEQTTPFGIIKLIGFIALMGFIFYSYASQGGII